MSKETAAWLNSQTLIGFTDKRGNAWHYRAEHQGEESNHYPGPIPVAAIERRLFHWTAQPRPLFAAIPAHAVDADGIDEDGATIRYQPAPTRRAITRSDTGAVLGIVGDGYTPHQYGEWLIRNVSALLSDTVSIGSAGLLAGGARAWVSVEVPEPVHTPEGVDFRPNLLAATSHDGSLATTFKRVTTLTVCDNTMAVALRERGQEYKVKHSRHSIARLSEARHALHLLELGADEFADEVAVLCATTVTNRQWSAFLDHHAPVPERPGRSRQTAEKKRETLTRLYRDDPRAAPWTGTAFGVLQAVNTYRHHEQTIRTATRHERNTERAITGRSEQDDRATLAALDRILTAV